MNNYAQNNFNESRVAKEFKSSKVMMVVTIIVVAGLVAAFKHAIGG